MISIALNIDERQVGSVENKLANWSPRTLSRQSLPYNICGRTLDEVQITLYQTFQIVGKDRNHCKKKKIYI